MKTYNFPFTAILSQENMKLALILNIIDPKIGGVLLTGKQGTGKSTTVRSLVDIFPIGENIKLINLPLGSTEDMVIGSFDIEEMIRTGNHSIKPGLLAKVHNGILYVDEINLLPDHLVDILLDVSASGINIIERDGISYKHASSFILIGSMNPEEGELRPQISDRMGLKVSIKAPSDPELRAEITHRVIDFNNNPKKFIKRFNKNQDILRKKIKLAKQKYCNIKVKFKIYLFISEMVAKLGFNSQRIDLTFLRCARAYSALKGRDEINKDALKSVLFLVFGAWISENENKFDDEFLGMTFDQIWHKIPKAFEDIEKYAASNPDIEMQNIFKFSEEIKEKYKEKPLNQENYDLPEIETGERDSKDKYSNYNLENGLNSGYKVGDNDSFQKKEDKNKKENIDADIFYRYEKPVDIDVSPLFLFIQTQRKKIVNYSGRGSQVKILSKSNGRFVYARKPRGRPHSIAFNATIKNHYLQYPSSLERVKNIVYPNISKKNPNLAINLTYDDVKEKIYELHAPLSLYFIVDASASMRRTLKQTIKVIQSIHAQGYKKKDKVSVISFQRKDARILQRPSVSFSIALKNLQSLEPTSYTPLASALEKTIRMIRQEKLKGVNIPIVIILSDLGANISLKYPDLNASSNKDFEIIAEELNELAIKIGRNKIFLIVMKPKKSFATRFLGVDKVTVEKIEKSFRKYASAQIFEFDSYDPENTIIKLKKIIKID